MTPASPAPSPAPAPTTADPGGTAPNSTAPTTALIIGTDAREPGSFDGRADVIVLAQVPADRSGLTLVSVARDTYVPVPGHGEDKVNAAYAYGGAPLLEQTVTDLFGGLAIDHVVQTNFGGFSAVAEALEGFEVDNEHASTHDGRAFDEGVIELDGADALDYVRERYQLPLGDLDRAERHRAALTGMLARLAELAEDDPAALVRLAPALSSAVRVDGGLDVGDLTALVGTARGIRDEGRLVSLMVPVSRFATVDGQAVNILDAERTAELGEALRRGDVSDYVARYGTGYAPTGS